MIFRRINNKQSLLALLAVVLIAFGSCRKEDFDQPPSNGVDPDLTVNMTLDSLKKIYQNEMTVTKKNVTITNDWTIKAVVVADDESGNLYKTIVVDDGTAGMSIRLDISNYNTNLPVGRQVYVKLKGLCMGPYAGLVQMGGYIDSTSGSSPTVEPIPASLVTKYMIAGTWGNTVTPYTVSIADLGSSYKWQSRLIKINDVKFQTGDTLQPWANNVTLQSVNRYLTDCYGNTIIVRTSGYSNFASELTPTGAGSFTAVFSVYNADKQLILRDPSDVSFTNPYSYCPPTNSTLSTIADLRVHAATSTSCPNVYIRGTVISDYTTNNLNGKNVYIQDATGGIVVRFASNHSFVVGDSIQVECTAQTLSEFSGLLQVGGTTPNVPNSNAIKIGTGTVTPRIATISQIKANINGTTDTWESTLVKVMNVTFIGGGTYSGSKQITDGVDTLTVYTATGASFSGASVPTSSVSVTAILSDYSNATAPNTREQLVLRSTSDVQ